MFTSLQKNQISSNKRRLATQEGCLLDLGKELPIMFKAFYEAFEAFENEIRNTPPIARARGFEASLLNSKMIQSIQNNFPDHWKFGKYKRFTLQKNGYTILFKKLNKKNMPMNIKTNAVNAISQQLSIPLFNDTSFAANPILFFGYKKNKLGGITDPQLIYIDEDKLKWVISENQIQTTNDVDLVVDLNEIAVPKLKEGIKRKKASNE